MTLDKNLLFTSKANTLTALKNTNLFNISPVYIINYKDWKENKEQSIKTCIDLFQNIIKNSETNTENNPTISNILELNKNSQENNSKLNSVSLAVRSSCKKEDSKESSMAGEFLSLLNVKLFFDKENNELEQAIDNVFNSYGTADTGDQVLIQAMLSSVLSGVLTTKVLTDGAPYYIINYDDESMKTDTITSGTGTSKTVSVYKQAKPSDFDSQRIYAIVEFAKSLEKICNSDELDIEFCMDSNNIIYLLQVRPLCTQEQWIDNSEEKVALNIDYITTFLEEKMAPQEDIFGKTTILGFMPDWNPAEMIGVTPRLLTSSLYRYFITRRVWSKAREIMGYRVMPPQELMILLAGRPFIDVRLSFNSFLPQGVDSITAELLIDAWIERLNNNTQLHDKVEFEVASTALDFCFKENFENRYAGLLTQKRFNDYHAHLTVLTRHCIDLSRKENSLFNAFDAITELSNRQNTRSENFLSSTKNTKILPKIVMLAEECRKFGTLPFSILARHAFIAESLLRSAVTKGALTAERLADFKNSIQTISGLMSTDFQKVHTEKMTQENFLKKYGHLRPSTYDILSPRYADREGLFSGSVGHEVHAEQKAFSFTQQEKSNIEKLLQDSNLPSSLDNLKNYAYKAIAGREYAKFIFSRNISDILELISSFANSYGLDKEVFSFVDIRDIMEWSCHVLLDKPQDYFGRKSQEGRELFDIGRSLKLSYLIRSSRDILVVPQQSNTPNLVGRGRHEAPLIVLDSQSSCSTDLTSCIVCIENADPGFDWIFTRPITGLITKFGGTNSHMAIRCAEYGLPAAIGVGDVLFAQITQAKKCLLNIDAGIIMPL